MKLAVLRMRLAQTVTLIQIFLASVSKIRFGWKTSCSDQKLLHLNELRCDLGEV